MIQSLILLSLGSMQGHATATDTAKPTKCACSDSVFFDGYYVVLYTKDEINNLEKNRQRRLEGKSYRVQFESSMLRCFVSKDSMRRRNFTDIVEGLPRKNKKEVFIECTKDYAEDLGKAFCIDEGRLLDCAWPALPSSNKYFVAGRHGRYCCKIYQLSGWFIKLRVDTEAKRDAIGKKIRYIDPQLREFDAYFFVRYKSYAAFAGSPGDKISLWKEVPSVFE